MLKDLLAKKNEQQNIGKKKKDLDTGKGAVKDQVTITSLPRNQLVVVDSCLIYFFNYDRILI